MCVTNSLSKILSWVAAHERPLGAGLFALGFLTDLLTFGLLPVGVVNIFFLTYLALAGVCTFGTHVVSVYAERDVWWRKTLSVAFPLGAQYALGGLLSGFFVFYGKSSVIAVSWPFLLLLFLVYAGNEYFRAHKAKLVFQTVLFFFALYAYAIFALPLVVGTLGPWVFLGSTAITASLFGLFLFLLKRTHTARYRESRPRILGYAIGILLAVNIAYFGGFIPPIPLVLTHAEVYHELVRTNNGYQVVTDAPKTWWNPFPRTVPLTAGSPLYFVSAVNAPGAFSTTLTHEWEHLVPGDGWQPRTRVSFRITGGRAEGYRGYSVSEHPEEGMWRVTVRAGTQVVGRLTFKVERASTVERTYSGVL